MNLFAYVFLHDWLIWVGFILKCKPHRISFRQWGLSNSYDETGMGPRFNIKNSPRIEISIIKLRWPFASSPSQRVGNMGFDRAPTVTWNLRRNCHLGYLCHHSSWFPFVTCSHTFNQKSQISILLLCFETFVADELLQWMMYMRHDMYKNLIHIHLWLFQFHSMASCLCHFNYMRVWGNRLLRSPLKKSVHHSYKWWKILKNNKWGHYGKSTYKWRKATSSRSKIDEDQILL